MTSNERYWTERVWNYSREDFINRWYYLMLKRIYIAKPQNHSYFDFKLTTDDIEEINAFNTIDDTFTLTNIYIALISFRMVNISNSYLTKQMLFVTDQIRKGDMSFIIGMKQIKKTKKGYKVSHYEGIYDSSDINDYSKYFTIHTKANSWPLKESIGTLKNFTLNNISVFNVIFNKKENNGYYKSLML